jgi:hypothetical protein
MVTRLTNIAPVQLGKVAAVLYAIIGLLLGLAFGFTSMTGAPNQPGLPSFRLGWLGLIIFPIVYAILGFIGGIIYAWLYNLVAGWVGGIEVTLETRQPVNTV